MFIGENPPHLVIEVEPTQGDAGKPGSYRILCISEMWRINVTVKSRLSAESLDRQHTEGWQLVPDSLAFPGLTDVQTTHTLRQMFPWDREILPGLLDRFKAGSGPAHVIAEPGSDPEP